MKLNGYNIILRIAKNTNDRPGAFVTLWKRCKNSGNIIPFDENDNINYILISVNRKSKEKKRKRN